MRTNSRFLRFKLKKNERYLNRSIALLLLIAENAFYPRSQR